MANYTLPNMAVGQSFSNVVIGLANSSGAAIPIPAGTTFSVNSFPGVLTASVAQAGGVWTVSGTAVGPGLQVGLTVSDNAGDTTARLIVTITQPNQVTLDLSNAVIG